MISTSTGLILKLLMKFLISAFEFCVMLEKKQYVLYHVK